jgi:hypothetical protein
MDTSLFLFEFTSPLTRPQVEQLARATGMRIGDVGNPAKDTPGRGQFAGNANIDLIREEQAQRWYIRAYSRDLSRTDLAAIQHMQEHLRAILPVIASEWHERYAYPESADPAVARAAGAANA